jgi:hypothetical protein
MRLAGDLLGSCPMNIRRDAVTRVDNQINSIERVLEAMREAPRDWIETDSHYLEASGVDRSAWLAQLCQRVASDGGAVARSFTVVGQSESPSIDDGPAPRLAEPDAGRTCGRQYSLALLALLDALTAEPSSSPLATSTSLDDVRATAFLVAGEMAAARPDPAIVDRAVRLVDRRLAELRVPLRATGYLAARDVLGRMVAPLLSQPRAGGP